MTKEPLPFEGAVFTDDAMQQNGHKKLLGYDHNTVTYLNEDGTRTIYVSSVPVETCKLDLHKEGEDYISNSTHVSVTFPKHLHRRNAIRLEDFMELYSANNEILTGEKIDRTNVFGAKLPCIRYDHFFRESLPLYCYATSFGVNLEIVIPEYTGETVFSLRMKQPTGLYSEVEPDYIAFQDERELKSVIYTSLAVDAAGKWCDQNRLDLSTEDAQGAVEVYFTVNKEFLEDPDTKYPVTLNQSFYLYRHKQPDTSIYSVSDMYARYYLSPYMMLGKQTPRGEGRALLRFEVLENLPVNPQEVLRAEYCFTNLVEQKDSTIVGAYAITADWCSVNTRWRSKPTYDQLPVSATKVRKRGVYGIEITGLLIEMLRTRGTYEPRYSVRNSFLIKSNTKNSCLLLTAGDAGFFPPYLKITLKNKESRGE